MGDLVNLNKARKQAAKIAAEAKAAENRIRFGQPKAAKRKQAAETEQAKRLLDAKRLD